MGSEAPTTFFYKDQKKKNIFGPLSKEKVLQRYGQNHFKKTFSFCFLTAGEERTPQTKFHTLSDLIKRNGSKDPFKKSPESSNQNSDELEEQADETANALEDAYADNGRQSQLSTGPMWVIVNTAWQLGPQANAPAIMTPDELANAWAAYYLDVLEAYKTNEWDKVYEKAVENIRPVKRAVANSEAVREKCYRELMIKLPNLDHAYCYECGSIFHNYKQILMHVTAEHHNMHDSDELQTLKKDVNDLMWMICKEPCLYNLTQEEDKHIEWVKRHRDDDFAAPDLRPLKGFVNDITQEYVRAIFGFYRNAGDEDTFAQMVAKMIPRLKTDDFHIVSEIMHKLDEHIGNKQTRCFECNAVTGNKNQYYEHMLTFAHIIESNGMDLITLTVNLCKRPDNPVITEVQEPCEQSQPSSRSSTEDLSPTSSSSDAAAVAPAVANAAAAATAAKKPDEEISEDAKANAWAAYYLNVLDAYKTGKWDKVDGQKAKENIKSMSRALESESLREKCHKELEKRLKELDYAYCSECSSVLHNYKQIVMHVTVKHKRDQRTTGKKEEPTRKSYGFPKEDDLLDLQKKADLLDLQKKADLLEDLKKNVNVIMKQIYTPQLKNWKEEEDKYIKEVRDKHSAVGRGSSTLHPTKDFVADFKRVHDPSVYGHGDNSTFEVLAKMIPRFKRDEASRAIGLDIFNKLHEHIADNLTRCANCDVITGHREDYCKHLCTFHHIKNAGGKDLITLIVNLYKTPERAKLVNELTTYYLDVLEAYKTRKLDKVTVDRYNQITRSMQKQDFTDENLRETIYDVLKFRLTQLDMHFYCRECDSIFHDYKQILMHAMVKHKGSDTPLKLLDDVNDAIKRICRPQLEKMIQAERTLLDEMVGKYAEVDPASSDLSPLDDFVAGIKQQYSDAIYGCDAEQIEDSNFAPIVAEMIPRLKKEDNHLVSEIMNKLDKHLIGATFRPTRCVKCNVVTGTREDYYKHLRTNGHLTNADGKDLITLVVNMCNKE